MIHAFFAAAAELFKEYCKEAMGEPPPGATYPSINPADYNPWSNEPDHKFHMACPCGFDHVATKVPTRSKCVRGRSALQHLLMRYHSLTGLDRVATNVPTRSAE